MKRCYLFAILFGIVILLAYSLDGYAARKFNEKNAGLSSESALMDIMGELRYTVAALLWLKTDYYQHEYENKSQELMENEPIMPLIRLVTILDPHFVQAYDFGSYHLSVNLGKPKEGEAFMMEGLRNNPDSFDLNWEAGFINYFHKRYKEALPYLLKARTLREQHTPVYDSFMKMNWVNSKIVSIYKKLGEPEKAIPYKQEMDSWNREHIGLSQKTKKQPESTCSCGRKHDHDHNHNHNHNHDNDHNH